MIFALWLYPAAPSLVYGEQDHGVVLIGCVYTSNLKLDILSGLAKPIFHIIKCEMLWAGAHHPRGAPGTARLFPAGRQIAQHLPGFQS